jgi:hypothetical protein
VKEIAYWTPYGDFHYSRRQIRWLLENEEYFKTGCWPGEPAGEYLTDRWDKHEKSWIDWMSCGMAERQPGRPPVKCEGSFCKAAEVYGETMRRLEATGKDGKLLLAQIRAGYTALDEEADDALGYISGQKAKLSRYPDWLRQRHERQNIICVK